MFDKNCHKTKIIAEQNKQEIFISREFDIPVELLFKAYTTAEIIEQWMENKVLQCDCRKYGVYEFEVRNADGKLVLLSGGVIHEIVINEKIVRTFKMENTEFPVQLEYLEFLPLEKNKCKLLMQVLYKSVSDRDAILSMPFEYGINRAHDNLQMVCKKLNYE